MRQRLEGTQVIGAFVNENRVAGDMRFNRKVKFDKMPIAGRIKMESKKAVPEKLL
jgi:hypothetical protein